MNKEATPVRSARGDGRGERVLSWARLVFVAGVLGVLPPGHAAAQAQSARTDSARVTRKARSPKGAMLRSVALPGWGQFYNRRFAKGGLVAAAEMASVAAYFVRRRDLADDVVLAGQAPRRNAFLLATTGLVFLSAVDAFVDAHLDGVDWGEVRAGPDGVKAEVRVRLGKGRE